MLMGANVGNAVETDLIELAAYVYAADQLPPGGATPTSLDLHGGKWRRYFRFEVPVRRPDLWGQPAVRDALVRTLGFLSDDDYEFVFRRYRNPPLFEQYLFGAADQDGWSEVEEGSSCSAAGWIRWPGPFARRWKGATAGGPREPPAGPSRVRLASAVWRRSGRPAFACSIAAAACGGGGQQGGNYWAATGRAAEKWSFLFAAMAALVARLLGRSRVRFYEKSGGSSA